MLAKVELLTPTVVPSNHAQSRLGACVQQGHNFNLIRALHVCIYAAQRKSLLSLPAFPIKSFLIHSIGKGKLRRGTERIYVVRERGGPC